MDAKLYSNKRADDPHLYTLHLDEIPDNDIDAVTIIISIDSGCIQAGFGGSEYPLIAIPNIVAPNRGTSEWFIGKKAYDATNVTITSPIQNGDINDWNALKYMLSIILHDMKASNEKLAVLVTECVDFSEESREKMTQFMFEEIKVSFFFIIPRSISSIFASGRITACCIHSDYHCTEIVPIWDQTILRGKEMKVNIGRRNLLRYLERKKNKLKSDNDAFKILFEPQLCQTEEQTTSEHDGLHILIKKCIQSCDFDMRRELYQNIVLSGINTIDLDPNAIDEDLFKARLLMKLKGLQGYDNLKATDDIPAGYLMKVISPPKRGDSSWIGGSFVVSLSTFEDLWMTEKQYQQRGASIMHKISVMDSVQL